MEEIEKMIEKARVLVQMNRLQDAMGEVEKILSIDPDNYVALTLSSSISYNLKDKGKTKNSAEKLVAAYPADDVAHYYMALAFDLNKKPVEAEREIREAIAINPYDADYFAFLSGCYIDKKEWEKGLEYANQGLEIEPENISCLNHRTLCLTKLERDDEILTAVEDTLSASPDNWYSHANVGWSKLETSDYEAAKHHFAEALRLNPNADYARQGMKEVLKAKNFLYKWYLKYQFWISKMGDKAQWAVLIGFVIGRRVVAGLAAVFPPLYIVVVALFALVYSIWIIQPLGDFILLLDPLGKYVLTGDEKKAGTITGIGVVGGIIFLVAGFAMQSYPLLVIGGVMATAIIPLARYFHEPEESRTAFIKIYTLIMGVLALACMVSTIFDKQGFVLTAYIIGIVAYTWIYNIRNSSN